MSGLSTLRTPGNAATGRGVVPSIWRGTVVETYDDGAVAVLIPGLFGDQAMRSPCLLSVPMPGDLVIVAAVEGRSTDLVVIGTAAEADSGALELSLKAYTDDRVATRAPLSHRHPWADLDSVPASFPPSAHTHAYSSLSGIPATFAPAAHSHLWADLTDKPTTFAPTAHAHPMTDLTGVLTPAQLPAATSTTAGAMSAADKAKLDTATSAPTAGAVAQRNSAGRVQVAEPGTDTTAATTKNYVDTAVGRLGYARSAGTVAVPVLAAGATTTVTITFPASRFSVAPLLTLNSGDGRVTVGGSTVTATGATVTVCNYTAAASAAATGQWQAVQMTAAAAAG